MSSDSNNGPLTFERALRLVRQTWCRTLNLPRVADDSRFLDVGGDSLDAVEIATTLEEESGVDVEPSDLLLKNPTTRALADWLLTGQQSLGIGAPLAADNAPGQSSAADSSAGSSVGQETQPSFGQARLYQVEKHASSLAAPDRPNRMQRARAGQYVVTFSIEIGGSLNIAALQRSLDEILVRHAPLRTCIFGRGDAIVSKTMPAASWPLEIVRLETESPTDCRQLESEHAGALEEPFDLTKSPLVRGRLLYRPQGDSLLILAVHHVAIDAWSIAVFVRELAGAYRRFSQSEGMPLPGLPASYADFVDAESEFLDSPAGREQARWWRDHLRDMGTLELPGPHAAECPPECSPDGARYLQHASTLAPDLSRAIRELSRRQGCTPFMTCLAALQVVLARFGDGDDFVVVSPMSCRTRRSWDGLIGFFVNLVPLRARLHSAQTVAELLRDTRDEVSEAFRRRSTPLDQIVAETNRDGGASGGRSDSTSNSTSGTASGGRFTQAAFAFYEPFPSPTAVGETVFGTPRLRITTSRFPLEVHVWDDRDAFRLEVRLDTTLLDHSVAENLPLEFVRCLEAFCESANDLAYSPRIAAEHVPANQPAVAESDEDRDGVRLENRFEEVAAAHFDHIAISAAGAKPSHESPAHESPSHGEPSFADLTYGDLLTHSRRLAAQLVNNAIRPGDRVAIACTSLPAFVTAMLGTLRAGGCYVPVDPSWPAERIRQIVTASRCQLLLCDAAASAGLSDLPLAVLRVDGVEEPASIQPPASPLAKPPANLPTSDGSTAAYVMFTSGSTGSPKGVVISHAAVLNLVADSGYARLSAADVVAQASPRAFDASTFEIWGALLNGATLAEVVHEDLLSADRLQAVIRQQQISKMFVTTALFNELARQDAGVFGELDTLLFGGERVAVEYVQRVLNGRPPRRMVHVYGPTETTTFATWHEVRGTDDNRTVPIGRPLRGVRAWVLDRHQVPVPAGVAGELYIGGCGLALGYENAPQATAERFVPDPLAESPGQRLFRTGDRVRRRPDGELEFVERMDDQIKIRGYRIEPGEIEAVLRRHESVRDAAVAAVPVASEATAERRLIAWVKIAPQPPAGPAAMPGSDARRSQLARELSASLEATLPLPMVPSQLILVDALPRNANGKIDRSALQWQPPEIATAATEFVEPQSDVEAGICRIFADLLKLARVGSRDDFFRLGGHSLLATQLLSRIRSLFGVSLPIQIVFQQPTAAGLATAIEHLQAATGDDDDRPITRLPRYDGVFPVSFAQQRLWFVEQLEPGTSAYHIPLVSRLLGPLDIDALQRAVDTIVQRHEALRTSFTLRDGEPVQVISELCPCPFDVVDVSMLPADEREAAAKQHAASFMAQPFDLSRDCMLRVRIVRAGQHEHILLICMHHIAADGWSLGIFIGELAELYRSYRAGQPASLAELPIGYADFSVWQREQLRSRRLESLVQWWQQRLAGLQVVTLPTDYPRPDSFSGRGRVVARQLPKSLETQLRALGREQNATLFMTMLAAFQVLLSRYSGQTDIAIGSPIANRNRTSLEGLIGFFVNTLVMRTDVGGDPTFRELLDRVGRVALDAWEHQDLPFERLVEQLQPVRDTARNPLFEITFGLQNAPLDAVPLEGLAEFDFDVTSARFDLELDVRERPDGLTLFAFYREELFTRGTIVRLLEHYHRLLAEFASHPDRPLSSARMLSAEEFEAAIGGQSPSLDSRRREPAASSTLLHELFERQAARQPSSEAASDGVTTLTFAQLDAASGRLAARLLAAGVQIDEPVAFPADRSLEMLVSTLGVLKAGAACLPLDPKHPPTRQLEFVRQAGVRFCLVLASQNFEQRTGQPRAGQRHNDFPINDYPINDFPPHVQLISIPPLPTDFADLADTAATEPVPRGRSGPIPPSTAAYILFTSGSTGRPHGVVLSHAALVNFVSSAAARFDLQPDDRFLQFASPGFDVVIEELFPVWSVGGSVQLASDDALSDPTQFSALIEHRRITAAELPAAFWRVWIDQLASENSDPPRSLRLVLVGCEQPEVPRLQWWQRTGVALQTVFGLTETAVTTSSCRLPAGGDQMPIVERLPLGPELENTRYLVLDADLNPVPAGVVGELFIGGLGLARGYLADPALTAARFLPDPYSRHPGERLYRTGDLAKRRGDGGIEFIGRRDNQFNLRGYRIEAEEVEAAFLSLPSVAAAAATLIGSGGDARLAAYVVLREQASDSAAVPATNRPSPADDGRDGTEHPAEHPAGDPFGEPAGNPIRREIAHRLRRQLQLVLPQPMIPDVIFFLDHLPMTPHGKIDRGALPDPASLAGLPTESATPPQNATQRQLLQIWSEVLRCQVADIDANFFELGGHSLLAMQVVARVRRELDVSLPLSAIFASPTVRMLAESIDGQTGGNGQRSLGISPVDRDQDLQLSFGQQRLWFLNQLHPSSCAYNIVLPLRLRGRLNRSAAESAVAAIAGRHEVLRTIYPARHGKPVQVIRPNWLGKLKTVDATGIDAEQCDAAVARHVSAAELTPFDLTQEPAFRCDLVRFAADDHLLLFCVHHIAADGWSMGILVDEFLELYDAFVTPREVRLKPLAVQFADVAAWQRQWADTDEFARQMKFWESRLRGLPPLELPTDFRRSPHNQHRGDAVSRRMEQSVFERAKSFSDRLGATNFMTFAAAFHVLLYRLTGKTDIATGFPAAGRDHHELEPLIGFLVNTLVLRSDLSGDPTFASLVANTRTAVLEAMSHAELPFEQIVEQLRPDRSLAQNPLFQVMFAYEAAARKERQARGLDLQPADGTTSIARFDLEVHVIEDGDAAVIAAVYDRDLFETAVIEGWLDTYAGLLESLVSEPDKPLAEVCPAVVSPHFGVRSRITHSSALQRATTADVDKSWCGLHELFAAQAARHPDHPAVSGDGQSLTYAELDEYSGRLAARLQQRDIGPETRVAIVLERTPPAVAAILGILKVGGAYVPLDPQLPPARLRQMLSDARPALILCDDHTKQLASSLDATIPVVEVDDHAIADATPLAPQPPTHPHQLAYILYTSGSTGVPKGVGVTHENVIRLVTDTQARWPTGTADRWTLLHGLGFDFSVWEMWGALLSGGHLFIVSDEVRRSPAAFCDLLISAGITVLNLTPTMFSSLLADSPLLSRRHEFSLRLLMLSGEPAEEISLQQWFSSSDPGANQDVEIVNLYGITETTVFVSGQAVGREDVFRERVAVPIGHSLRNWECYVLDEHCNPLPPGAVGEIFVGGRGLARGYWRDPRTTAERFIPNPWGEPGSRLYRSGDLGRFRADGILEHRGRLDEQVKIRGHRVELAEIRLRLQQHRSVQQAAVTVAQGEHGEPEVVAYVVPKSGQADRDHLRTALFEMLRESLPKWMLPSVIVCVDQLPLGETGKLARERLPRPRRHDRIAESAYVPPRDQVEQTIADHWSEVLGYGPVGVHDDFFELGGHSLLAAQVAARIGDTLQVKLPLRLFFEKPSIGSLAAAVRDLLRRESRKTESIAPLPRDADLPLSFAQRRLWFLAQFHPQDASLNVPIAFRIRGKLDQRALQQSLDLLVRRHEAFRTRIVERNGQPHVRIGGAESCPLPTTDLTSLGAEAAREKLAALLRSEDTTPLPLASQSLFRTHLIRCTDDESVLVVTFHHIVSDAWSANVLEHELSVCYQAFRAGRHPQLPELTLQYADYAAWEQSAATRPEFEHHLSWWQGRLAGATPTRLPRRDEAVELTADAVGNAAVELSPELTAKLQRLARDCSATVYMLLLAALDVVLAAESDSRDIVVGTPVANRYRREFERVLGFFVNMVVMRTEIVGDPAFDELLRQVREDVLAVFAHQDLSFERLVEELRPARSAQSHPLFNILFSFQNAPFESRGAGGDASLVGMEILTTRFDLELLAWMQPRSDSTDPPATPDESNRSPQPGHDRVADSTAQPKSGQQLQVVAVFREQLFSTPYIEHILNAWVAVLSSVVEDPQRKVSELVADLDQRHRPSQTPGDDGHDRDRGRVSELEMPATSATETAIPADQLPNDDDNGFRRLDDVIAEIAAETPDAIALRDADIALSYRQLDEQANQLARALRRAGVRHESAVGIFVERSAQAILAMVGILRAGGVFVPLSTEWSGERLRLLIEQAEIEHVVGAAEGRPQTAASHITWIDLTTVARQPADVPLPPPVRHPDTLAYIMFTSGSTGVPKAVGVTHQAVHRLVADTDYVQFDARDVVAQIADIAFDGSTFEIWGALLHGATLQIVDRATAVEAGALGKLLVDDGVTMAFLPTSLFHQLASDQAAIFRPLRYLIVGGERLDPANSRKVLAAGVKRLVNGYGPTETTTFATAHPVQRLPAEATSIPIGKPILGVECFVLDEHLQPVSPGEAGELFIAGSGLARGYINDPALTAARFLPHPFAEQPGQRVYRTGDMVRWLPSGAIDFLRRNDQQLKIRGHRVEPAEIEAVASQHPEVGQAVIVVDQSEAAGTGTKDPSLICYLTRKTDSAGPAPRIEQQDEHIVDWRRLYEDLYDRRRDDFRPDLNLIGWNSSLDGAAIPAETMLEQIEQTVRRIERLDPQEVLEIGCGTGLLLYRLAGRCRSYVGTDFSAAAIEYVESHLPAVLLGDAATQPPNVELLVRDALDFSNFRQHQFDTVILNSVVQYLPSVDYLLDVLRGINKVVRPGGQIFLGDIRSHALLNMQLTAVALHQADDGTTCDQLRHRIDQLVRQENELLLDPRFFFSRLPLPLADVRIELKEGTQHSELTQYRYDVVLTVAGPDPQPEKSCVVQWIDRGSLQEPLADLRCCLEELAAKAAADDCQRSTGSVSPAVEGGESSESPSPRRNGLNEADRAMALGVRGLPDARVCRAAVAEKLLGGMVPAASVAEFREAVEERAAALPAVDPQDLWNLGRSFGLDVEVRPSLNDPGCLDVIFAAGESYGGRQGRSLFPAGEIHAPANPRNLANDPLLPVMSRELGGRLTEFLNERLPEYMVPHKFVLLERFPLNANGKVDRRALPAPPGTVSGSGTSFVEPRTPTEQKIAEIWAALLNVDRVGATDNFFRLGGHSLLATQVATRLRTVFRIDFPLRMLFESQTVEELADRLDQRMSHPNQDEQLPDEPPITVRTKSGDLPLSFAQQRLWFLEQLDPDRCAYNMPAVLRIQGPLDRAALQASLDEIIRRHEALRTVFPSRQGQPYQRILPAGQCPLAVVDLTDEASDQPSSDQPSNDQRRQIGRYAKAEETTPFDLEAGPLIRGKLLRCADDDWVLLLTMHHIVSDGWSIPILTRELAELYAAHVEGRPPQLPPLPVQYADFACWQRETFQGQRLAREIEYWQKRLADLRPIQLPTDHAAPARRAYRGGIVGRTLPPALARRIRELGHRENATLFITMLAAFEVLLFRWSRFAGRHEAPFAVGTPIANRRRDEIEGLIGFFVNTLVMTADVSGDPSFDQFLARTRTAALEAFEHQDLPFEKLVEELRPDRHLTQNPLFQVLFAVQNAGSIDFSLPNLTMSVLEFELTTTRFDLEIHVWEEGDALVVRAFYDAELFERETIDRLMAQYERLLLSIVDDPGQRISALPLLPDQEQQQLLHGWNALPPPVELAGLNERLASAAAQSADRISVVDGDRRWTYNELERASNTVAIRLIEAGVRAEELVPICFEPSAAMIVGMLGVLKAGGAYVPIDPHWPRARIRQILDEIRPRRIVAGNDRLVEPWCAAGLDQTIVDDEIFSAPPPDAGRLPHVHLDQLAYVMYTSGSTGAAKGVQITHRNISRLFEQAGKQFEFCSDDAWSLFHAFTFDFSVWEIFGALLHGARLVIVPEAVRRWPQETVELLRAEGVTVFSQTPTAFSQLLSMADIHPLAKDRRLRYLIFGGESLDPQLLRPWFEVFGDRDLQVVNMYGITETTVHVTFQKLQWQHLEKPGPGSPIGRRLADLQIYLLDEHGNPVPRGSIGEIHVGGQGLARGYLGDPSLTAERFVPHPWGPPGERLYRTGDLARHGDGDTLEFWGRVDEQVKLRGYRIEPAEIERCLRRHDKVLDALVTLREPQSDDPWLVGYVTTRAAAEGRHANVDPEELSAELHRFCRAWLPEQMLPRAYVVLDKFPRTSNGKIDRSALPRPAGFRPECRGEFVAPGPGTEKALADIWQEVLKIDSIGAYDNFFELGGHSLLATQVVSRIRDRFEVDLPLRAMFETGNVVELGRWVEDRLQRPEPAEKKAPAESAHSTETMETTEKAESAESADSNAPAGDGRATLRRTRLDQLRTQRKQEE